MRMDFWEKIANLWRRFENKEEIKKAFSRGEQDADYFAGFQSAYSDDDYFDEDDEDDED